MSELLSNLSQWLQSIQLVRIFKCYLFQKPNGKNPSVCSPQLPAFKERKQNCGKVEWHAMVPFPTTEPLTGSSWLTIATTGFVLQKISAIFASSESRQENLVLCLLVQQELLFKNRILNRRLRKKVVLYFS